MTDKSSLISTAAKIVCNGGVVIVPTETFYALAADPFNSEAVAKIYQIKSRTKHKPLPLIASDQLHLEKVISEPSILARKLMERFWPGSLTMLFTPSVKLPRELKGPDGKIAIRIPPDCLAKRLAASVGGWITATSANLSGDVEPQQISMIANEVVEAVDMVIDVGPTPGGKPSTLVDPLEYTVRILREGAVEAKLIEDFIASAISDIPFL